MNLLKKLWALAFHIDLPTPLTLATTELEEAERELMVSQTGAEWANAKITYNQTRITRLRKQINALTKEQEK